MPSPSTKDESRCPPEEITASATPVPLPGPNGEPAPAFELSWEYPFIKACNRLLLLFGPSPLRTSKKARYFRWAIFFSLAGILAIAVLLPIGIFTDRKAAKTIENEGEGFATPALLAAGCDPRNPVNTCVGIADRMVYVNIFPIKYDPTKGLTVLFDVGAQMNRSSVLLNKEVKIEVDTKTQTIPANTYGSITFTATYDVRTDSTTFPFDEMSTAFSVFAYTMERDASNKTVPVLLDLYVRSANSFPIPSFAMRPIEFLPLDDGVSGISLNGSTFPGARVTVAFRRSNLTRFITMLSWILMHLWTIMGISLTAQAVFRGRDAMSLMVWVAATIFSMKTIRDLQPAAPPIGTIGDMCTYIYCTLVIAVMAFILFCVAFREHKPKSPWDKAYAKMEKASKWRAVLKDEAALESEKKEKQTMPAFNDLPTELIDRSLILSNDLHTSISVELLLASYPRPFWIRLSSQPGSVRDAIDPLLPPCWSNLTSANFPISLGLASQIVLLKWNDVATIPAYVVTWVAQFAPALLTYSFVSAAAEAGRLDLIRLLHAFDVSKFCTATMDAAARSGNLAIVRFLHTQRKEGCTAEAMTEAIRHSHLDVARFLASHRTERCTNLVLYSAASKGDLDAVRFLQTVVGCEPDEDDAQPVPDLKTLRILHEELGWPISLRTVERMAKHGADTLRYCLERFPECNPIVLRGVCCGHHSVEAMAVANEFFPDEKDLWSSENWNLVAGIGSVEHLEWLYNNRKEGCTLDAVSKAATARNLEVIKYLRTKGLEPDSTALLSAVRGGSLELVQYLRTIPALQGAWGPGLTQEAAISGNLAMIKYLWKDLGLVPDTLNFTPYNVGHVDVTLFAVDSGFSFTATHLSHALIEAAKSKDLETIQRLHDLVPAIPDVVFGNIYEDPAKLGRLEIIQFFHENRVERPSPRALFLAASQGQTEVARYLVEEIGMRPTLAMIGDAAYQGQVETMLFLLDYLPADSDLDGAIEQACMLDRIEALRWLHRRGRAKGDLFDILRFSRSLDVVQELVEVYGTQLDQGSVESAAFSPNFDTSKWILQSELGKDLKTQLHVLFSTGSPDLVLYAIENKRYYINDSNIPLVLGLEFEDRRYLYDDLGDPSQPSFLNIAAALGDPMTFARLLERYPEQCTTRTAELAARKGILGTVRFLGKKAPHVFAESVLTNAIEGSCSIHVVEYLLVHHPACRNPRLHLEVATRPEDAMNMQRRRAISTMLWRRWWEGGCPFEAMVNSCRAGEVDLLKLFLEKFDVTDDAWRNAVKACSEISLHVHNVCLENLRFLMFDCAMPSLGHPSLPNDVLLSILLHLHPEELPSVATVNRCLRQAVPACFNLSDAQRHLSQVLGHGKHDESGRRENTRKHSTPLKHPALLWHAVAAVELNELDLL
ncbi:hypothetical protein HDU96_008034, partial [Phlyctochytrium bullatum]